MERRWFLHKIPKILHIYYGGKASYLNYLTITSFIKHNPDWSVMFYYPVKATTKISWTSFEQKYQAKWEDYTAGIKKLPISCIPVNFEEYGISNKISEVHKSDFIRWRLLSSIGGLWCDMDILFFAPITNLAINKKENSHVDTVVSISHYGHSIGFMMASYDNFYFKEIDKRAGKAYTPESYQCMGSAVCNQYYPTLHNIPSYPINLGMEAVYHINADNIKNIYLRNHTEKFPASAIGLHWYAGHPLAGKFLNETNGGMVALPNNVIGNLIKKYKQDGKES